MSVCACARLFSRQLSVFDIFGHIAIIADEVDAVTFPRDCNDAERKWYNRCRPTLPTSLEYTHVSFSIRRNDFLKTKLLLQTHDAVNLEPRPSLRWTGVWKNIFYVWIEAFRRYSNRIKSSWKTRENSRPASPTFTPTDKTEPVDFSGTFGKTSLCRNQCKDCSAMQHCDAMPYDWQNHL